MSSLLLPDDDNKSKNFTPYLFSNIDSKSAERETITPVNAIDFSHPSSPIDTMPSPPLSPYTRNFDESETRFTQLIIPRATKPILNNFSIDHTHIKNSVEDEEEVQGNKKNNDSSENNNNNIVSDNTNIKEAVSLSKKSFPIDNLEYSSLIISPFNDLNKPSFKKRQMSFLSEYQFKKLKTNNSSTSYIPFKNFLTRSAVRSTYDTVRSDFSDNDKSDPEKPRTRRFVRQNNVDLESDVDSSTSVISRSSTPVRNRKPINKKIENLSNHASPQKRSRTSTPSIVYNYDYRQIEDFSPPLDSLPNSIKCLKTDWKGQSMDLSSDPLVGQLHPAEVLLASTLRLPCHVYLDSKRRIFSEKVRRMRNNLPFRRTDAQKSCKIDVNKASRLFASFEKVNWFDEKYFKRFM